MMDGKPAIAAINGVKGGPWAALFDFKSGLVSYTVKGGNNVDSKYITFSGI